MEGTHVIDVDEVAISTTIIHQDCESSGGNTPKSKTEFPLIRMVKRHFSGRDNEFYKPSVLSIGPYHHKTSTTLQIEKQKWESLSFILQMNPKKKMRDFVAAMEELEHQIRSCYADEITMSKDKFLKMMLLDGCFILCLLVGMDGIVPNMPQYCNASSPEKSEIIVKKDNQQSPSSNITKQNDAEDDAYYIRQWYATFFSHDLLLLENQIPFFVVMKIHELIIGESSSRTLLLLQNIANSMALIIDSYPKAVLRFDEQTPVHHLLHLCHMYFKPGKLHIASDQPDSPLPKLHRASEYHKSGVEFRKREHLDHDPFSLLDIGFSDGVLEMPCLTIDTNTHRLFRNLIAFEETCPEVGNYMTTYIAFLSQFMNKPEDVSLLTKRGIVVHELSSDDEVSYLFRMLSNGVTFDLNGGHHLKPLFHAHYQTQRPVRSGWLGSISSVVSTLSDKMNQPDQLPAKLTPEQYV